MRRPCKRALAALMLAALALPVWAAKPVEVGSKKFTESVILGEITTQLLKAEGVAANHREQLGGTRVLWSALLKGDIDVYPEYTGTLRNEIFSGRKLPTLAALRTALAKHGVKMTAPLGFNNTYALGMKQALARHLHVRSISDLKAHPNLTFGFSNEFMDRADGWPGLKRYYGLPQTDVRGLDHDLAYRGLEAGTIQVTDLYSTDAEIAYYHLRTLKDDRGYFPDYQAVLLYRSDLSADAAAVLERLQGTIDEATMRRMNAQAKIQRESEQQVAAGFLRKHFEVTTSARAAGFWRRLWQRTLEHLTLVAISLSAAIVFAVPLGVLAWLRPRSGQVILSAVGIVQTIPALALLVFMIPLLGIGGPPAIVALFLYSLLPIVRNTYAGLHDIPTPVLESARALGLPPGARLRLVQLPLAARSILAGIKTSAVINIGTATLGALIGAGGYGQPILTGIRLDDTGLILQGAVPAALLALAVQGLFELAERVVVPKGLRPSK